MSYTIPVGSAKSERAVRFARELERAMKARGVGARTIAEATGMGRSAIRNWRSGRNLPRLETARNLAAALDWERLAVLGEELRTKRCPIDGQAFLDDSGSDNRAYCSPGCRRVGEKRRIGTDTRQRADTAERLLRAHRAAVAAYCAGCEPSGRCVTAECELRPVSPLPLYASRIDVEPVQPKPRNGYREPGADSARMARIWDRYDPAERQARIDRAAEASRVARGLVQAVR